MEVEIDKASREAVEFAESQTRYNRFFEEDREVFVIDIDSLDELYERLHPEESFIVWGTQYDFDETGKTGSAFDGIDTAVTIYDYYIE